MLSTLKTKRLEELASDLGMQVELVPLLQSNGGYKRFEDTIAEVIERYKGETFAPAVKIRSYSYYSGLRTNVMSVSQSSFEAFKLYYGIDCEPKDSCKEVREILYRQSFSKKIAKAKETRNLFQEKRLEDELKNRVETLARRTEVYSKKRIECVTLFLKNRHKADIWYGSI